jgi:transposase InsO family protein
VLTEHGIPIAPSTYYARRAAPVSAAELADAYATDTLVDLHRAHRGLYGVRKLWHAARRAGHPWGRDRVGRLMQIAGIDGVRRGRRTTVTTRRDQTAPRHPDLEAGGLMLPTTRKGTP